MGEKTRIGLLAIICGALGILKTGLDWWGRSDLLNKFLGGRDSPAVHIVNILFSLPPQFYAVFALVCAVVWCFYPRFHRLMELMEPRPLRESAGDTPVPARPSPPPAAPIAAAQRNHSDVGSSTTERQVVDVTPQQLARLFEGQLDVQGQRLLAPYRGRWMRVFGLLDNVKAGSGYTMVTFATGAYEEVAVVMFFDGDAWADRLSVLTPGERITVIGQIEDAARNRVRLDNCDLVT